MYVAVERITKCRRKQNKKKPVVWVHEQQLIYKEIKEIKGKKKYYELETVA